MNDLIITIVNILRQCTSFEEFQRRTGELISEYPAGALVPVAEECRSLLRERGWTDEMIEDMEDSIIDKLRKGTASRAGLATRLD